MKVKVSGKDEVKAPKAKIVKAQESVEEINDGPQGEEQTKPTPVARVSAHKSEDMVKVTMFETIDPAPRIGQVSLVHDHGYPVLSKGETYFVPRNCALVLAESKKAAIIE